MIVDNPEHAEAPANQWLTWQNFEQPLATSERQEAYFLRVTQASFERNTGLLVPARYRVATVEAEPWPLSSISPEVLPPLETCPPRAGHDMEDAPLLLVEDPSEPNVHVCEPCEARAAIRDGMVNLVTTVLQRHESSCLDDGSDFERVRDDLVAAFMEVIQ